IGRGEQAGHTPEVIPVIVIVGAQVFGAEAGWEKPLVDRVSLPFAHPFAFDPVGATFDCGSPRRLGGTAADRAKALHDPERFAVGVPLALLREEIAKRGLAVGKLIKDALAAILEAR